MHHGFYTKSDTINDLGAQTRFEQEKKIVTNKCIIVPYFNK